MAPGSVRAAVLPARDAHQPRPDPPGRQRGVGSGAARHRDLQLPARRAAAVGVGDRHPRAARPTAKTSPSRRSATTTTSIGNIHVSWADPNKVREVVAVGSRRRVVFDDLNDAERVRVYERGVSAGEAIADSYGEFKLLVRDGDIISPKVEPSEPLKNQCLDFVQAIAGGRPPLVSGRFGIGVVRTLVGDRRLDAAREERPLKSDLPGAVEVLLGANAVIDPGVLLGYPSGRPGAFGADADRPAARDPRRLDRLRRGRDRRGLRNRPPRHRPRRKPHRQPLHDLEQHDDRLRLRDRRPRQDPLQHLRRAVHHASKTMCSWRRA